MRRAFALRVVLGNFHTRRTALLSGSDETHPFGLRGQFVADEGLAGLFDHAVADAKVFDFHADCVAGANLAAELYLYIILYIRLFFKGKIANRGRLPQRQKYSMPAVMKPGLKIVKTLFLQ